MAKKLFKDKLAFSTEGFFKEPPAVAKKILSLETESVSARPRAFRLVDLAGRPLPQTMLESKDGAVKFEALVLDRFWASKSHRMINADGNEIWFVFSGCGFCYTSFGWLWFTAGDYIFIPRSTLYRILPINLNKTLVVGVESEKDLCRPDFGELLGRDVPYAPEKVEKPKPYKDFVGDAPDCSDEWLVYVKRLGSWGTIVVYPFSPFLRESWEGERYPFVLHASDINALVSPTTHLDPSAFATFITDDKSVVVSTFKSRWIRSLPYYHMNWHDEFLFYAEEYEARGGVVGAGDATFHPQGVWHGPQIEALMKWKEPRHPKENPWVEELAIMFESRKPLMVSDNALKVEIPDYWKSWYEGWKKYKDVLEEK